MQESSKRMTDLTADILDFARGKLGGGVPLRRVEDDNLEATLALAIEELRTVHPEHEIRVDMALERPVYCDSARVAQLLSNLVGNALTHGAVGVPVEVSIHSKDGDLAIDVVNAGEVIPRHKLAGLFHPFARGRFTVRSGVWAWIRGCACFGTSSRRRRR
jgi:signal transduction histidine kinase